MYLSRSRLFGKNKTKRLLLIMQLTGILLTICCLAASANVTSQITLKVGNASLKEVFSAIHKQSGYYIIYNGELVRGAGTVNADLNNVTIREALDACLNGKALTYVIDEKTVIIKAKPVTSNLAQMITPVSPPIELKGKVINENGEPLAGAYVTIKRTGKGTITNANGEFILKEVFTDDIIILSYVGYKTLNIKIGDQKTISVNLQVAHNELDRTIVQAYGITSQRYNVGNIAKVSSEEIARQPVLNPLVALQGKVAGLVVNQMNGQVSAPVTVTLRGRNMLGVPGAGQTPDPLYIVDGVPFTVGGNATSGGQSFLANGFNGPAIGQSPFFSIDPLTIESIEVLKDADATSIYGSRRANGVIIITTKKGKTGAPELTVRYNQGFNRVSKFWEMLDTQEYLKIRKEAFFNDSLNYGITQDESNSFDLNVWDNTRYTDWQKLFYGGTGSVSNAQITLATGTPKTKLFLSGSYNRSTDITTVSGKNQRGSFQFNISESISDRFKLSLTGNYSSAKIDLISIDGNIALPPNTPSIFDEYGRLNYNGWGPGVDYFSFSGLMQPYESKTNNLISNIKADYEIFKGLTFRLGLGITNTKVEQIRLFPDYSLDPRYNQVSSSQFGNNSITNWIVEPQLDYNVSIGKGKMAFLFGSTLQNNITKGSFINASVFPSNALIRSMRSASSITIYNDVYSHYRYNALFARLNYNLLGKYILNLNARRDGSSRFGPENRFGNFWSLGAAWIFSEENWFKNASKIVNYGKFRSSYGTTGGDGVGDYSYLSQWYGTYPYNMSPSLYPSNLVNPYYQWQVNRKMEVGLDFGFLNNRILLGAAWYRNRCGNQLTSEPQSSVTGFSSVVNNSPALVENAGWEVTLQGKVIQTRAFNLSLAINSSQNRNKLIDFPNLEQSIYANQYVRGQSLNLVRTLKFLGVDSQSGLYKFEDKNKDGIISVNPGESDDRYLTTFDPTFTGGFGLNAVYKKFSFSTFFNIVKQKGFSPIGTIGAPGFITNLPKEVINNYWQKPGDQAEFARLTTQSSREESYAHFSMSDATFTDASFIRMTNLSLAFEILDSHKKKRLIKSCDIFLQGQNLFIITNYKGIDPETQNFGGMPPLRTFLAGIQITL
jgi:TonB-linked SusC/RagA family outer membrane protein